MSNFLVTPGVHIGATIAIIFMSLLLYSSHRAFRANRVHKVSSTMKITSFLVFISFIVNAVCIILGQGIIPRHLCTVRIPVSLGSFCITRCIFFYFLVIRVEVSFTGSSLEISPCLMKSVKIAIITVYGLFFIATILFAPHQVYENDICFISDKYFAAYAAVQGIYALTDLLLGVFSVGVYLYRLHKVYKEMKISGAMAENAKGDNANEKLLQVIKKQGKLAYIAYLSTAIIVMILPPLGITYLTYIDCVINVLCVYCSFDSHHKWYQYLCNCNGNPYLQYIFCYVGCCCCNERRRYQKRIKHIPQVTGTDFDTVSSPSNGSTKVKECMDSQSSNNLSDAEVNV